MKHLQAFAGGVVLALSAITPAEVAYAADDAVMEEIVVTGSRIRRDPLNESAAILDISNERLSKSGVTNLGDILQDLPITGSAPNSQFNVPGNSGFPQDGAGIGAGSVQLSLRNVGAKRTLILVDGKRWIAGSSASGVPSTVDLNTLPANVIKRIEILQDGASAIYGSDAIGGVVNIITDSSFDGFRLDSQVGEYMSDNDGGSSSISALWGGGNDTTHFVLSLGYTEERGIDTASRRRSAFPNPDASSCNISGTFCSSFTPQARLVLGPNFGFTDITLNDGVLNDGGANIPAFDPADPFAGDFHGFSSADRFNYNGPGFNFLRTPNERTNIYATVTHEFTDSLRSIVRASYTKRKSETKAAPEPLCLFDCGNRISDNFVISALNPFNPFGVDISVANGNGAFFGRRPLESGRRLFFQDVDSYFISVGLEGDFEAGNRTLFWDLTASYGDNSGFQEKKNSHNIAKLQIAMGDPAVCAQVPNCVPFNFFGGQGPDGNGSFTQEMLDFVTYTQRDFSEQSLKNASFNITGDILTMPAGELAFAAGFEYRDHEGSYRPDPIAESGETAGIPAGATVGQFDVKEFYAELNIPLLATLEANVAARSSDYSTSGSESTYKGGLLWKPIEDLSLRGSVSTGFRAPGIGELFGGAAREDFTFTDPCADYTGILGSIEGGRDAPQSAQIQTNCAALGVPVGVAQLNPQLSAVSAGNANLDAETSDAWTVGFVYSPGWVDNINWIDSLTASVDFYDLEIDDAIQGRNPGDVIEACINTLAVEFCNSVPRNVIGRIGLVNNQLQNIGRIESSGYDVAFNYVSPGTDFGQFMLSVNATHLSDYTEITNNPDGSTSSNDRTGTHTDETFARAFPDWRVVTSVDWVMDRWSATMAFRWVDEMELDGGDNLDSVMFTDLQVRYNPRTANDGFTLTVGFNNVFDEDPPVCFPCGVIGLSTVSHDLPGRVGYLRFSYELKD
ncbi:MAG: TonB-dependent receptor [Gammaproteobacteria bacterium]|nr:TonB-dependent receptor [Gammaproteobacteria bacterium]